MSRRVLTGVYLFAVLVGCPLLAWNLAIGAANHGFGWRGFFIVLLGLPAVAAVVRAEGVRR